VNCYAETWGCAFAKIFCRCDCGGHGHSDPTAFRSAGIDAISTFSEQLSPAKIVAMLNGYFEQMIGAVFKNFGYLNRFVNEDLAALRDAARDSEFQKEHAGQAALDVRKALSKAGNAGTSAIKTVS
jgi:adenylate cyclase